MGTKYHKQTKNHESAPLVALGMLDAPHSLNNSNVSGSFVKTTDEYASMWSELVLLHRVALISQIIKKCFATCNTRYSEVPIFF